MRPSKQGPRITWSHFRAIARAEGCKETPDKFTFDGKRFSFVVLTRIYGDQTRFYSIPADEDDDFMEWVTLRSACIALGISVTCFGTEAARHAMEFGV